MKLTASKSDLVRALGQVVSVADPKSTMPILANVKLTASGSTLALFASRLTLTATTELSVKVEKEGSICLPARDLFDRVRAMPEGDVTIEVKGTATTIKAKGAARKFTLHGVPSEEFPLIPEAGKSEWEREFKAIDLLGLLVIVSPAISADESRPHLNGMLIEVGKDGLRAVATDGHRLHSAALGNPAEPDAILAQTLVPLSAVSKIKGAIEGEAGTVRLSCAGPSLWVTVGDLSLCCALAQGTFPPWRQVVPASSEATVTANRQELLAAVKAVTVAASSLTSGMVLGVGGGKLSLKSESADGGEGLDDVPCEVTGKAGGDKYGFNAQYVAQALSVIATEQVELGLSGELDPVTVRAVGGGDGLVIVLMPMRI